jgi:hypothetical protein
VLEDYSGVGPTAISLRAKPDVSAPGSGILSSVPGGWTSLSGTSMASPHVAGAAALLLQRHPSWTAAQVKSALVQTGTDVLDSGGRALGPQFQGGGVIALARADRPLLFAEPSAVSFGLVTRDRGASGSVQLADAGGGAGTWQVVEARSQSSTGGATLVLPTTVEVPGILAWQLEAPAATREGEVSGFLELRRGAELRRVPFWGRVTAPALPRHRTTLLDRTGVHRGTTRGRPALVSGYRYPENPSGVGVARVLNGPEAVYRVRITRRVANFGVAVTGRARGVQVEPRVVSGLDENRITGYAGLPFSSNPYAAGPFGFRSPAPIAGALSPVPGEYAVVFDSRTRAGAGAFTFRYWVNDVTPPALRLLARVVRRGEPLLVTATDAGSGVDPSSILARVGGSLVSPVVRGATLRIPTGELTPGRHRLELRVSDHQEAKNTENVGPILPNTRTLTTTVTVRLR